MSIFNIRSLASNVSARAPSIALLMAMLWSQTLSAATFLVNSTNDANDGACNATHCSLREAINAANTNSASDTINFGLTLPVRGEILIAPTSALPTINQPAVINGYSQNGTSANTDPIISNANLRIRLSGINSSAPLGLTVCANSVTVKGISFSNWDNSGAALAFGTNNAGNPCGTNLTGGVIAGNFFGLNTAGLVAAGNTRGISIHNAVVNVGSSLVADRNVISSTLFEAISISGTGSNNSSILGNLIGTDLNGTQDRGNETAIRLESNNVTVGTNAAPNLVRFNRQGVRVISGLNNALFANHISDTEFLGISLLSSAVPTPNDTNDGDTGANGLQNFPIVTSVTRGLRRLQIEGTLDVPITALARPYTLGVYASFGCHSSGNGEGEIFVGSATVNLRGNVNESFAIDLPTNGDVPIGYVLTMTATGADGTSEFSTCTNIDAVTGFAVNSTDDAVDGQGCDATHCSLREAINAANARPGPDSIRFLIPVTGTSELLIEPTSVFPPITDTLTIDGYTQTGTQVNTDAEFSNAVIRIHIRPITDAFSGSLFELCADDITIRGLSVSGAVKTGSALKLFTHCPIGSTLRSRYLGNFFGLRADGTTAGSTNSIIDIRGADASVGGTQPADRNVFASASFFGVRMLASINTHVLGNLIGTDKTGTLNRGLATGLSIEGGINIPPQNIVVGTEAAPNVFRFNGTGIRASSNFNPGPARWTHNVYSEQTDLAIDLGSVGAEINDVDDLDGGANGEQNSPDIQQAFVTDTGVRVVGLLDVPIAASNAAYTLSFYANASCDPSNFGEGDTLIGVISQNFTQTTGESFDLAIDTATAITPGMAITAIATGPEGSSEFSRCRTVVDPIEEFTVDLTEDSTDGACTAGDCTLREAIEKANATAGPQIIRFNIPGASNFFSINLLSALPTIAGDLTINGYTQPGFGLNGTAIGSDAVIKIEINAGAQANIFKICDTDATASTVEIRGLSLVSADRVAIDSNTGIACTTSTTLVLRGNFFGLRPDGSASANQAAIIANNKVLLGSGAFADRNLIASNIDYGLRLQTLNANSSVVTNNLFGLGIDGLSDFGNGGSAIELDTVRVVRIGGLGFEANEIRFNERGIVVKNGSTTTNQNRLNGNEFSGQTGLSIDLWPGSAASDGVTGNDVDDVDTGANDLQNFPELSSAASSATDITINGTLDVPPSGSSNLPTTLTFYLSDTCNTSLHNEASSLLGAVEVGFSNTAQSFSVTLPAAAPIGPRFVSATATNQQGSTSELSTCLAVTDLTLVDALFENGFE